MRILPIGPALLLLSCADQPRQARVSDSQPLDSGDALDSGISGGQEQSGSWLGEVSSRIGVADREFQAQEGVFHAVNRPWSFSIQLDDQGALLQGPADDLALSFVGWGRGAATESTGPVKPAMGACIAETDPGGDCARRVEYDRGALTEWWANRADGLQLGWDLDERPAGDGPIVLEVAVDGATPALDGERVLLLGDGGGLWTTDGLAAWDANGDALDAWFEVEGDRVRALVDDQDAVWPITVDPITSTAAVTFTGPATGALMGTSVGGGGDVNGDGYSDIIVGAPGYSTNTGVVYIYNGSSTGPSTTASATLSSPSTSAYFGVSVDIAGDVNNDGYDDVIVGGSTATTTASADGAAWVYHGSSSGLSTTAAVKLTGSATASAYFGWAVASAGDVNGDGYDDVIIGEYGYSSELGRAWVYGGSSSGITTSKVQTFTGTLAGQRLGWSVSGGGDTTGDGYSDVAFGSPYYGASGAKSGRANYVKGISTFFTTAPTSTNYAFSVTNYMYGASVNIEGSYNGDAYADLVVGAQGGTAAGLGRVYWYRSTGTAIPTGATSTIDGPGVGSYFGAQLTYAGDVDGDGYGDLLIAAPTYTTDYGYAALYLGTSTGFSSSTVSTKITGSSGNNLGQGVARAGDVNKDGYADVLIGAPGVTSSTGRATLHYGGVDADSDGYLKNGSTYLLDCDDTSSSINPAATEVCDASDTDENCDGAADGADAVGATVWYLDSDGDGYGTTATTKTACDKPSGYVAVSTDCDDSAAAVNPAATEVCDASDVDENCDGSADDSTATGKSTWYQDLDSDAYGDPASTTTACDLPSGYVSDNTDCDDSSGSVNPGATEVCDASNTDEDCDGTADGSAATGKSTWYRDADSDAYGDPASTKSACDLPSGYVANNTDCDDSSGSINPAATEVCDASDTDEDCDGSADDSSATGGSTWYRDADSDAYGDPASTKSACDLPSGYVADNTDCDDTSGSVNPSALEVCDALDTDEDCDGAADDATATGKSTWYRDADSDEYGDSATRRIACNTPSGYVGDNSDCDDTDGDINPGALEVCDALDTDEDCDGAADDSAAAGKSTWYRDADSDTYGDSATSNIACNTPSGYVDDNSDCDDSDGDINPGASEVCDSLNTDEDCDGLADDSSASGTSTWYRDGDSDSYGDASKTKAACDVPSGYVDDNTDCDDGDDNISPSATEVCDPGDTDEDCDGLADDSSAVGMSNWYRDADSDSFGNPAATKSACDMPSGYITDSTDCDDTLASVNPGALEVCDSLDTDEDCDGLADDSSATGQTSWYRDADSDSYGDASLAKLSCDRPTGYLSDDRDCDDGDAGVHPGAADTTGDGLDSDCDGGEICYVDADADGYVDGSGAVVSSTDEDCADAGEASDTALTGDCDDADPSYNPGAAEPDCTDDNDYNCDGSSGYADKDGDGFAACEDCDDDNAAINPDGTELAGDLIDSDCDGLETCYYDGDDDGYVVGDGVLQSSDDADCSDDFEASAASPTGDCDDADDALNPGATEICDGFDNNCDGVTDEGVESGTWYADADNDGYGDPGAPVEACTQPAGTVTNTLDCDDGDAEINPSAFELCDDLDVDEDCDGFANDDSAIDQSTWHRDYDGDGYGDALYTTESCFAPSGYVASDDDCDDLDADANPGATEIVGDGDDEDCDGAELCYVDDDGDGYRADDLGELISLDADCADAGEALAEQPVGDCDDTSADYNPGVSETDCADPNDYNCDGSVGYDDDDGDGYAACEECDDSDSLINPDQTELVGDLVDSDCDGFELCYLDADDDGYVDGTGDTVDSSDVDCVDAFESSDSDPTGDCDDSDALLNPGAEEVCDLVDNDCDASVDEGVEPGDWYADLDGDGYGDPASVSTECDAPDGTVSVAGDCDDGDVSVNPGASDIPGDGVDQDCDGSDSSGGDTGTDDTGGDDTGGDDTATDDTATDDTATDDTGTPDSQPDDTASDDTGHGAGQDTGETDKGGRCGCATPIDGRSGGAWGGLLGLLALIGLRRRR